jgi:hypothetical protein
MYLYPLWIVGRRNVDMINQKMGSYLIQKCAQTLSWSLQQRNPCVLLCLKFTSTRHWMQILDFSLQFDSHGSRTPLSITNFGRGHASFGPLSNLEAVTQAWKLPENCKKDEIFHENVEILGVSRENSAAVEHRYLVMRHTPYWFERNSPVMKGYSIDLSLRRIIVPYSRISHNA